MKKEKNLTVLRSYALAVFFPFALFALGSCKPVIEEEPKSEIPDETSTYWENDYSRFQLKGNVKTMSESYSDGKSSGSFKKLSFDQKGNLIEDVVYENNMLSSGLKFTHNAENRITRCEYYAGGELSEIAEIGYGGENSHTAYLPTNIYIDDFRLQKGVTRILYKNAKTGKPYMSFVCTSITGNQLLFETAIEGYNNGEVIKNAPRLLITLQGAYPAKIEGSKVVGGVATSEYNTWATITFGKNGIPNTLNSYLNTYSDYVVDYIVVEDYLQVKKQVIKNKKTGNIESVTEFTYNEHGYLASKQVNNDEPEHYYYEYDERGNWTKRTCGESVVYRKFTYLD